MPNRTQAPQIVHAVDYHFQLPDINKHTLPNGSPIYWYRGGTQDVAEVCFVLDAGLWQEPAQGLASAVGQLLRNGTTTKSAFQINDALEYYGASLRVAVQNDYAMVVLHSLSRHLPALIPLVAEVIFEAIFPEDELSIFQKNGLQRLQVQLKQCDFVANQKIDALLFGERHPYGRYTTAETFHSLNRDAMLAFHRSTYVQGPMTIYMGGMVDESHLALLEKYFGQQERKAVAVQDLMPIPVIKPGIHHFHNDENGVQAAIRLAAHFPNRKHTDFPALVLLNTLLGGYFGSRLMTNIREDKGYTYGIHSMLLPYQHAGEMMVSSEVGKDVGDAAIAEVYKEMALLRNEPVEEDELLLVKNYLLGNLLGDLDGPFQIIHRWRSIIQNGQEKADFEKNVNVYKTCTVEQLQQLAQQYLKEERFITVSVI